MRWFSRLFSFKRTHVFTPPCVPTDAEIEEAEARLGVELPPSFRAFLRRADDLVIGLGATFYWVGCESYEYRHIADVNRPESREWTGRNPFTGNVETTQVCQLPEYLVAFFTDGMGNELCFDTCRADDRGEYPIVFWDHELSTDENIAAADKPAESRQSCGVVTDSFDEWLLAESAAHRST